MSKHREYEQREYKGRTQIYVRSGWRYVEERECFYCGRKFLCSISAHDKGRFCSPECVGKENYKNYSRKRAHKKCKICFVPFEVKPSHTKRYKTCGKRYCVSAYKRRLGIERWQTKPRESTRRSGESIAVN